MLRDNNRKGKKSLKANYIYNLSYQVLVLIIPLITTPYVSRVLGADGVGMYGLTNSISQYFVLFGCIGLNLYGQREIAYCQNKEYERSKVFYELLIVRLITMAVSMLIFICTVCNDGKYGFLYKIELLELIGAAIDITWFFQGLEEFKKIVIRNSVVKILGVVCILLFVKEETDTAIYTLILCLTVLIGNGLIWVYMPRYLCRVSIKSLNMIKHIKPTLVLFVPQIATSVYNVLDKSMIGLITKSDAEVAYYEQAQKIIKMALAMPAAVGTVMLPRMASLFSEGNHEEIRSHINTSMKFVCMLTAPLCIGIISIAKDFVPWFFGSGFDKVYDNFIVISPIIILVGMSNVLGVQYLLPVKRQADYTKSVIIGTIVNFTFNLILIPSLLSIGAAIGSIIAEASVTFTQFFLLRGRISLKDTVKGTYLYFIGALIMGGGIYLYSTIVAHPTFYHTIIEITIGVCIYATYLLLIKDKLVYTQMNKIKDRIHRG